VFESAGGIYVSTMDGYDGEALLRKEDGVKPYLKQIAVAPENHTIQAFIRRAIAHNIGRTKLAAHTFYVIHGADGRFHTLSFYGTARTFYSRGTWALDTEADMDSYMSFVNGANKWAVIELETRNGIDVNGTVLNILVKIDSDTTYYYKDHVRDKLNMNNCITALADTIAGDLLAGINSDA
jgi:hypothetical protein